MQDSSTPSTARSPSLWPKVLAWLALIAGLVIGLLTLFAAFGVWLGWWDFRQGFSMLGIGNQLAPWVAIAAALIAFLVFAGARRSGANAAGLGTLALVGSIVAAFSYYIPESYRPPEGTPMIHDISTDTANPPEFVAVVPLRADAPNSHVYGDSPDMNPEKLARLQREAYPDIETQVYDAPREEVFARALAAARDLGWDIVAEDLSAGRIEATDTTFWFRFKDDVVLRFREENGRTYLDARSVSRVGTSDVGKNAERLRKLFEEI